MRKFLLGLVLGTLALYGQTVAPTAPAPFTSAPPLAALPDVTVGVGPSWTRGGSSPLSVDVTLSKHLSGQWLYSWTEISTPMSSTGSQPVASAITTGGAFVPVQSASGNVALVLIIQGGLSTSTNTTSTIPSPGAPPISTTQTVVTPAFTGSFGVAFRLGKSHLWVMPYGKASNVGAASTNGALATAVFQPGVQLLYGFGGK